MLNFFKKSFLCLLVLCMLIGCASCNKSDDIESDTTIVTESDTVAESEGETVDRVDKVDIKLDKAYASIVHYIDADDTLKEAMKSFAKEVQKYVPKVMMTVVDTIPAEEIENCRKICEDEIGAVYRVREYIAD